MQLLPLSPDVIETAWMEPSDDNTLFQTVTEGVLSIDVGTD